MHSMIKKIYYNDEYEEQRVTLLWQMHIAD